MLAQVVGEWIENTVDAGHVGEALPGRERQVGDIREVHPPPNACIASDKGTDGVEAPFANPLDHARGVVGRGVGLAGLADGVDHVKRKGQLVPIRFGMKGAGKLALARGQPLVNALAASEVGVVVGGSEAAYSEMEEGVALRVHQDPALAFFSRRERNRSS